VTDSSDTGLEKLLAPEAIEQLKMRYFRWASALYITR
jgi:hypothetical protein